MPGPALPPRIPSKAAKTYAPSAPDDAPEGLNRRAGDLLGAAPLSSLLLSSSPPLLSPPLLSPPSLLSPFSPPPPLPITPESALLNPLAVASLGNVASIAATRTTPSKTEVRAAARDEATRHRFAMQDASRRLVPWERVARCCRYLRAGERYVEVMHSASEERAHFSGLEVCGSVWLCPVCASRVSEERRRELVRAVSAVIDGGGAVLHATFTVQHNRGDDLAGLLASFLAAYRLLTSYRAYKELRQQFQIFGSVRALEVTHGDNGWHPHYHVLLFLSAPLPKGQLDELDSQLRNVWYAAAKRSGLGMNSHGLKIKASGGAIADYVAKYGRDPKFTPWGVESELVKAHTKSGRLRGALTPWDLLRAFDGGNSQAGALFAEYAAVFKGRNQLVWSPGLRALLGLEDEVPDEDVAGLLPDDAISLGYLDFAEWSLVLRFRARGDVLNLAGRGDWSAVLAFVRGLAGRHLADRVACGLALPPAPPALPPLVQLELALLA